MISRSPVRLSGAEAIAAPFWRRWGARSGGGVPHSVRAVAAVPLWQTDRCGRRFLEAGDHRGQDRSRHADQFAYGVATTVRHPEVARAVDRHAAWSKEVRPGRGKVAEQGPVVVERSYVIAIEIRHPDTARAVDRHAECSVE